MKRGPYRSTPADGTVAALILAFRQSPRFLGWGPTTRRANDRRLGDFLTFNGTCMVADLTRGDFLRLRDSMAKTPGAASNWMKVINAILDYAADMGAELLGVAKPSNVTRMRKAKTDGN